jgi:D-galactarolactone isomerase
MMEATPTSEPKLKAPPGTWDTHMHIYDKRYPLASTAKIVHGDALAPAYEAIRKRLGIAHTVVVQPTAYGTDNSCTLDAMKELGPGSRGVAVVDQTVTDEELDRLTKLGIRGIRFFMLPGGALPWEILGTMAARVREFGWHVQLQLDGRNLPEREAILKQLPGTLVIDHVGKFLEPVPVSDPAFAVLKRLVENGRTWVKLSAPYEVSKVGAPHYDDVGTLAKVLVKLAPERMVWATNWPHPTPPANKKTDDAVLLDMLLDWVPDETVRKKVLVDNPAKLYG